MDEFTKCLNDYYVLRKQYEDSLDLYFKKKREFNRILPYENQHKRFLEKWARANFINPNDEKWVKKEWDENIPITMMKKSELRKAHALELSSRKKILKKLQSEMDKARNKLVAFTG